MNGFGSDLDDLLTTLGGIAIFIGFIVFVLPAVFAVLSLLSQGFAGNGEQAMSLLMNLLQPWWIGFALSASVLFVIFAMFLNYIGAEVVLDM